MKIFNFLNFLPNVQYQNGLLRIYKCVWEANMFYKGLSFGSKDYTKELKTFECRVYKFSGPDLLISAN